MRVASDRITRTRQLRLAAGCGACLLIIALLPGCGCGFDCGDDDDVPASTSFTLNFSDESLEELKQVFIEVRQITFSRSSGDDVVIETFTIDELDLVDAESFSFDLLDYRGRQQLRVIDSLDLDTGTYNSVVLTLGIDDVNLSYVQESDDSLKPISTATSGISLPGFTLSSEVEEYTVEFNLPRSLQYRSSGDDYRLTSEGVQVIDTDDAASVSGRVDTALFDTVEPCDGKADPEAGNRLYVYSGRDLTGTLADVYTDASSAEVPEDAVAPFTVANLAENSLTGSWEYVVGFLPAGDYTLAFSCDSAGDDPVEYDGLTVPLPTEQVYEINLLAGEQSICDLEEGASCE